jgi:hypothetical protein
MKHKTCASCQTTREVVWDQRLGVTSNMADDMRRGFEDNITFMRSKRQVCPVLKSMYTFPCRIERGDRLASLLGSQDWPTYQCWIFLLGIRLCPQTVAPRISESTKGR